jgi:nitrite reductase (NADH) small subunit
MTAWVEVCPVDALVPNRGVAALVGERQVAVFLVSPGDEVLAIDNLDPISGAAVLSRGIVGSLGDVLTVASPVYKQRFDLRSGACLDEDGVAVATYPARVQDGMVEVGSP